MMTNIDAGEWWVQRRFGFVITLEIRNAFVEVEELEFVSTEHAEARLRLEKTHNTDEHSKRDT